MKSVLSVGGGVMTDVLSPPVFSGIAGSDVEQE